MDPIYWTSFLAVAAPLVTLGLTQRHAQKMAKEEREGRRRELAFDARKNLLTERLESATAFLSVVEKATEWGEFNRERVGEQTVPEDLISELELARARVRLLADPKIVDMVDHLHDAILGYGRLHRKREYLEQARLDFTREWGSMLVADASMDREK